MLTAEDRKQRKRETNLKSWHRQQKRKKQDKLMKDESDYIAGLEFDFHWTKEELKKFFDLYEADYKHIYDISCLSEELNRTQEDVAILIMSLAIENCI